MMSPIHSYADMGSKGVTNAVVGETDLFQQLSSFPPPHLSAAAPPTHHTPQPNAPPTHCLVLWQIHKVLEVNEEELLKNSIWWGRGRGNIPGTALHNPQVVSQPPSLPACTSPFLDALLDLNPFGLPPLLHLQHDVATLLTQGSEGKRGKGREGKRGEGKRGEGGKGREGKRGEGREGRGTEVKTFSAAANCYVELQYFHIYMCMCAVGLTESSSPWLSILPSLTTPLAPFFSTLARCV